ncbi:DUF1850 domain-containing protein [Halorubrum sp. JWXQ-INN 858]|uniref:DUF1850 domain-containing protein n=1 Tax=Halorubrum sp. JWXQ-INN 858 TaxID=2690782 RepID=UPI00135C72F5|nr:DUF1850 domain-containing protein [Halorubrum sp. JWXQ-INN 858]MWV65874.1 DUF1850 domain-containing protein [Halorubrum sp. JWXQ-INN 858]
MSSRRLGLIASVVVLVALTSVTAAATLPAEDAVVLENPETGETYDRFTLEPDETFAVTYIHSFEKTPVTGVYTVRDGEIHQVREEYAYNAAGLGYTRSERREGNRTVVDVDERVGSFAVRISDSEDHYLTVDGDDRPLDSYADTWSTVRVTTERVSYLERYWSHGR